MVKGFQPMQRLGDAFAIGRETIWDSLYHVNIIYFIVVAALAWIFARWRRPARAEGVTTGLLVCYALAIPVILPNTSGKALGPRYLLVAIPLFYVLAALLIERWRRSSPCSIPITTLLLLALGVSGVTGAFMNSYVAAKTLIEDYNERAKPTLEAIRRHSPGIIVSNSQYAAQEFEVAMSDNVFFLCVHPSDLARLLHALKAQDRNGFLFVGFLTNEVPGYHGTSNDNPALLVNRLGQYGYFSLHDVKVAPQQ
jgi:hypothetical protein